MTPFKKYPTKPRFDEAFSAEREFAASPDGTILMEVSQFT